MAGSINKVILVGNLGGDPEDIHKMVTKLLHLMLQHLNLGRIKMVKERIGRNGIVLLYFLLDLLKSLKNTLKKVQRFM